MIMVILASLRTRTFIWRITFGGKDMICLLYTSNFNDLNCGPVDLMVEHNRDLFSDFQFTTRGDASRMLEEVMNYARSHGFPKVYILNDEYDNFTNQLLTAYNDPLYEEVTTNDSFLRTCFKVIKAGIGEGSIRTCFCTGVLRCV